MSRVQLLDHGYIEPVNHWGDEELIISSARMSTDGGFRGWGTLEAPGDERLLKYLWAHHHSTPFEVCGATFELKAPIFVMRELVRHRTLSFNEMSARYVPLPNEDYLPTTSRIVEGASKSGNNIQARGVGDKIPPPC